MVTTSVSVELQVRRRCLTSASAAAGAHPSEGAGEGGSGVAPTQSKNPTWQRTRAAAQTQPYILRESFRDDFQAIMNTAGTKTRVCVCFREGGGVLLVWGLRACACARMDFTAHLKKERNCVHDYRVDEARAELARVVH